MTYNINRPDLCQMLFNPSELWYRYTRSISKENRKCPFFVEVSIGKLVFFCLNLIILTKTYFRCYCGLGHFSSPDPKAAGNYMIVAMIHFKGIDEYICVKIFAEFYRS